MTSHTGRFFRGALNASLLALTAASAISCLKADHSNKAPAAPAPLEGNTSSVVEPQLVLPLSSLTGLRQDANQIRVTAFALVDGVRGEPTHAPYVFTLTDAGIYPLSGLQAGRVELLVEVLSTSGRRIAQGSVRAEISGEPQVLPEVSLTPEEATPVSVQLSLKLNQLGAADPSPSSDSEQPEAVRLALKKSACLGCHSTRGQSGGLVLDTFPYTTVNEELASGGMPAIVKLILERVTTSEEEMRMPPPPMGAMKPEYLATLQDFLKTLETPAADSAPRTIKQVRMTIDGDTTFTLASKGEVYEPEASLTLLAGSSHPFDLQVEGDDGALLFEVKGGVLSVPLSGQVNLSFDIPFENQASSLAN